MSNSIAALASKANSAANNYREVADNKGDYYSMRRAANELARATDALTAAIADEMS